MWTGGESASKSASGQHLTPQQMSGHLGIRASERGDAGTLSLGTLWSQQSKCLFPEGKMIPPESPAGPQSQV